jgi:hypothetical protein
MKAHLHALLITHNRKSLINIQRGFFLVFAMPNMQPETDGFDNKCEK